MEKGNSFIKMEASMMVIGDLAEWMEEAHSFIHLMSKPMKESGWMINSLVRELFTMKIQQ